MVIRSHASDLGKGKVGAARGLSVGVFRVGREVTRSMDFYLLVIALALQLQTILGEQLASDDQAADVVDIGTGPCIRQSRARDIGVGRTWKT